MWVRTTTSIIKRYEDLSINIINYESRLQSLYITVQNFKEGVDLMYKWAESTSVTIDRMTIVSYEIHILIRQIREIKVIFSLLAFILTFSLLVFSLFVDYCTICMS